MLSGKSSIWGQYPCFKPHLLISAGAQQLSWYRGNSTAHFVLSGKMLNMASGKVTLNRVIRSLTDHRSTEWSMPAFCRFEFAYFFSEPVRASRMIWTSRTCHVHDVHDIKEIWKVRAKSWSLTSIDKTVWKVTTSHHIMSHLHSRFLALPAFFEKNS